MTADGTLEHVIIGEDFTSRVVVGILDPGSFRGSDGAAWTDVVDERDVLDVYRAGETSANELRAAGRGVAIAVIAIGPFLEWCALTGDDPASPASLQAAAQGGVSDDVFEFEGSLASVLRARYVRESLLTTMVAASPSEASGPAATVATCNRLFRLIATGVEGYYQIVVSLDDAPDFAASAAAADYSGINSTGRGVTTLFSGLADGHGEMVFETDSDRRSVLDFMGLAVLRGGAVLVRSFGDRHHGVGGVSVYGWRISERRVVALDEAEALLQQYVTGAEADDDVLFTRAAPLE